MSGILLTSSLNAGAFVWAETVPESVICLETQGKTNPIGIDSQNPAFSWKMQSSAIGAAQTAYHIVVKDAADKVVWDSGEVESSKSNEIVYEGDALTPCTG